MGSEGGEQVLKIREARTTDGKGIREFCQTIQLNFCHFLLYYTLLSIGIMLENFNFHVKVAFF